MDKLRIKVSRVGAFFLHGLLSQGYLNYVATFEDTTFVGEYWRIQKKLVAFLAGEKERMQMTFSTPEYRFLHNLLQEYLRENEILSLFQQDVYPLYQEICLLVA